MHRPRPMNTSQPNKITAKSIQVYQLLKDHVDIYKIRPMVTGDEKGKKKELRLCIANCSASQFVIDLLGLFELFVGLENIESLESLHFLVLQNTFVENFCSRTG